MSRTSSAIWARIRGVRETEKEEWADAPESPTEQHTSDLAALVQRVDDLPPCAHMPLDPPALSRYLRARDGDVELAADALRATVEWRRGYGTDDILARRELLELELATLKVYVAPFTDRAGRPVIISRPARENTRSHEGNIALRVYNLERAIASAELGTATAGDGAICFVADFSGFAHSNAPPLRTARETVSVMQQHYPERLGRAVMLNAPRIVTDLWSSIQRWVDPVTREKVVFLSTSSAAGLATLDSIVDRALLPADMGGSAGVADTYASAADYLDPSKDPLALKAAAARKRAPAAGKAAPDAPLRTLPLARPPAPSPQPSGSSAASGAADDSSGSGKSGLRRVRRIAAASARRDFGHWRQHQAVGVAT